MKQLGVLIFYAASGWDDNPWQGYYDYQLSKAQGSFGGEVFDLKLWCCCALCCQ